MGNKYKRPIKYGLIMLALYFIFVAFVILTNQRGDMGSSAGWFLLASSLPAIALNYAQAWGFIPWPIITILTLLQYFLLGFIIGLIVNKIKGSQVFDTLKNNIALIKYKFLLILSFAIPFVFYLHENFILPLSGPLIAHSPYFSNLIGVFGSFFIQCPKFYLIKIVVNFIGLSSGIIFLIISRKINNFYIWRILAIVGILFSAFMFLAGLSKYYWFKHPVYFPTCTDDDQVDCIRQEYTPINSDPNQERKYYHCPKTGEMFQGNKVDCEYPFQDKDYCQESYRKWIAENCINIQFVD